MAPWICCLRHDDNKEKIPQPNPTTRFTYCIYPQCRHTLCRDCLVDSIEKVPMGGRDADADTAKSRARNREIRERQRRRNEATPVLQTIMLGGRKRKRDEESEDGDLRSVNFQKKMDMDGARPRGVRVQRAFNETAIAPGERLAKGSGEGKEQGIRHSKKMMVGRSQPQVRRIGLFNKVPQNNMKHLSSSSVHNSRKTGEASQETMAKLETPKIERDQVINPQAALMLRSSENRGIMNLEAKHDAAGREGIDSSDGFDGLGRGKAFRIEDVDGNEVIVID